LGDQAGLAISGAPNVTAVVEASVAAIHAEGAHAICYVDAGTAENWRSDYREFAPGVLGGPLAGWPGENFININDWAGPAGPGDETLQQIVSNRIALCRQEGFDAIEADNVDTYSDGNLGGFIITQAQEETYITNLVRIAHSDGLAFFLKNEINGDSLIADISPQVDGEITEQCWQYTECSALQIFAQKHKPILDVEYQTFPESTLCPEALAFPMATIQTDMDLDGKLAYGCWQYDSQTVPAATTTTTEPPPKPVKILTSLPSGIWRVTIRSQTQAQSSRWVLRVAAGRVTGLAYPNQPKLAPYQVSGTVSGSTVHLSRNQCPVNTSQKGCRQDRLAGKIVSSGQVRGDWASTPAPPNNPHNIFIMVYLSRSTTGRCWPQPHPRYC